MEKRIALVFGASGLVGKAIVEELCRSDQYATVIVFVRSTTGFRNTEKIKEIFTDFDNLKKQSEMISGHDIFICLGTTIKKAGSVKRMEEIDRDLPVEIASIASGNSVERLAIISSVGANPASSNYYLRIKGEMEREIMKLKFSTLIIARPSLLLGKRSESRIFEKISKMMMRIMSIFLIGRLARYKAIYGKDVAKAMVKAVNDKSGKHIIESEMLQQISRD